MMSTIEDVAKYAGVSIATVSRVLNNEDTVSEKRKKMVWNAVKALNYKPNIIGRILRMSESKIIMVVFSVLIPEFLQGVTAEADNTGYTLLFNYTPSYVKNSKPFNMAFQGLVDGVILQDVMLKENVLNEIIQNYPVVFCGDLMSLGKYQTESISINNFEVAYKMTNHLIHKGKKRIACVGVVLDRSIEPLFSQEREAGVRRALSEHGLVLEEQHCYKGDVGYETGRAAAQSFQKSNQPPDAIFCFNDKIAIGCISKLKEMGILVPEDVYVVGFDNLGITSQFNPSISTISQPFYDLGVLSVKNLIAKINGEQNPILEQKVEGKIILRQSTDDLSMN